MRLTPHTWYDYLYLNDITKKNKQHDKRN